MLPPSGAYCQTVCLSDPNYGLLDVAKIGEAEQHSYYYYGYLIDHDGAFVAANQTLRTYATSIGGEYTVGGDYATATADPLRARVDTALSSDYKPGDFGVTVASLQTLINNAWTAAGQTGAPVITNVGSGSGDTLMKLKEGIERFMITDINNPAGSAKAQSNIGCLWDRLVYSPTDADRNTRMNHRPGGNNVLFMDGHVEFRKFPQDKFPITKTQAMFGRF